MGSDHPPHLAWISTTSQETITGAQKSCKMDIRIGHKVTVRKNIDAADSASCLRRFLPPFQKPGRVQDVQWTHDTNTPRRSENNGIAERAVRRVKEGPATAIGRSGVPEEWWDCATRCCCYMRSVHDTMTDGKTAYENRFTDKFDGLLIPFGAKVSYTHILLKDESRPHQLGKKMLPDIFMGYVSRAGGG